MKLQEGQRITLNPSDDYDWAPTRGSMDIRVPLHGQSATVIQTGATLAVAEIDGGSAVVVDRVNDPRVKMIDLVRLREAREMARLLLYTWQRYIELSVGIGAKPRGHATIRARGVYDGACGMAHAIGYGKTTLHVMGLVRDTLPPGSKPRDWLQAKVVDDLAERLSHIYFGTTEEIHATAYGQKPMMLGTSAREWRERHGAECLCHRETGSHEQCCGHEDGRNPDCPQHGDGSTSG